MSDAQRYLIFSVEHRGWWRALEAGYTEKISEAGRYTRETARAICTRALPGSRRIVHEIPVPEEDVQYLLLAYRLNYGDRQEPWM